MESDLLNLNGDRVSDGHSKTTPVVDELLNRQQFRFFNEDALLTMMVQSLSHGCHAAVVQQATK